MTSQRRRVGSQSGRRARQRKERSSRRTGDGRWTSLKGFLFGTRRRIVGFAAAVGTVASAIGGVYALLPKPRETLDASFSGVTAYPEVSLEQYDQRSSASNVVEGAPQPAAGARVYYRLAADTTASPATSTASEATGPPAITSTGTEALTPASPSAPPSGSLGGSPSTPPPGSKVPPGSGNTPQENPAKPPAQKAKRRRRLRHPGARITTTAPDVPYPTQIQPAPATSSSTPTPQAPARAVQGARVTEGTGASKGNVTAVLKALSHIGAPQAEAPSGGEGQAPGAPAPTTAPTTTAPAPAPPPGTPVPKAQSGLARIVLPHKCRSSCGATQEIDQALTYDPNPVKAAEAVAAVFSNSRAEVVGRRLYPIGAEISYTVNLDGFAHSKAILEWSLVSRASGRPLAKPWWRNVVVAHIEPTVSRESLSGRFWVPVPPQRGDYLVHLVLLDANGVPHAAGDSAPTFH